MPDARHNPLARMSEDAIKLYPDADYLVTVKLAKNADGSAKEGPPTVTVHVNNTFKPVQTDLSGIEEIPSNNGRSIQLLPKSDEMLQLIASDLTVQYCTNRPRWFWMGLTFTNV
jgi:hypothetical protein